MVRDARELRGAWATFQSHRYADPPPDLAAYVSNFWFAEWDLRGQEPYRQKIVPYPAVHLTFRDGAALVRGLERGHIIRVLEGRGEVFGVTFRPGCFRPFLGVAVSTITGRSLPAEDVFGPDLPKAPDTGVDSAARMIDDVGAFLRGRLPEPDPLAEQAAAIVAQVRAEPQLTRVDALAAHAGLGVRRLQRLFNEYVGVGPKWVIRRYRLHEVGERLAAGAEIDWVGLAIELGYADQAHFVRDFTAMVGESPTAYARRYPAQ
ncbi:helix-turn-helix domain-containing protein [Actinoplanes friuliensis]|uniref:AraC family transcriptional regulator n=1 Tax=Actinoplanes friuliensis DSM 7358 TaxID=1246995 RepID=U5WBL8_9ACTN|nr:helix-turn-helix domain-containing protein [Actinoplanes friuliensis]AGZ45351.1 AraC family transcriptional regulator [Actinoplanes friuliensis DSM 7358]